jgi:uncharacterized protein (TIGR03083 family)
MDAASHRRHLEHEIEQYADALGGALPECLDLPVAACPGWDVRRLTHHLGTIHRWVIHGLAEESGDAPRPARPADGALRAWFTEGAERLLVALDGDSDRPCWTFAGPGVLGFWQRRQPQEHAVHRWDLQAALGATGRIDSALAADGVDEVVNFLAPRQVELGRADPPAVAIAVVTTDAWGRWVLGDGEPVATVGGPAEVLLLALWHRIPADDPRLAWTGEVDRGLMVLGSGVTP